MAAENLHVIVGLGKTGISCARYLKQKNIPFIVTDTRHSPPNLPLLKAIASDSFTQFGPLEATLFKDAAKIVLSPGVALREPVIQAECARGIPVVSDIELFADEVKVPVIGITGTNAKSTVTTLVGMMANASHHDAKVGGNLGVPALDLLMEHPHAHLFILELSSFQLETTSSLKLQVASILNITPDHMDRYDDLAAYQKAKHRIYNHCQIAVCNRDDPLTECKHSSLQHKFHFTLKAPKQNEFGLIERKDGSYLAFGKDLLLLTKEMPLSGKHYYANALAALAIGHAAGFSLQPMLKVLREFKGLPHRCELIAERKGVKWYNDSKGTNVGATKAAIEGLGSELLGQLILIAGGVGKNADFTALVPAMSQYARQVILIGEAKNEIAKAIGNRVDVCFANTMDEAVFIAAKLAKPNDIVLLSPACASFDMFKNYEDRGHIFSEIVAKLN